jgi:hypothetical protein
VNKFRKKKTFIKKKTHFTVIKLVFAEYKSTMSSSSVSIKFLFYNTNNKLIRTASLSGHSDVGMGSPGPKDLPEVDEIRRKKIPRKLSEL